VGPCLVLPGVVIPDVCRDLNSIVFKRQELWKG
jgi:hypothetical protein